MYKQVSSNLNFVEREKDVLDFWKENKIFEKSLSENVGKREYTFYDGPPTANGKPHIGHVLTRVIKDMIPRYRTMKGYNVPRKAGWDTHGLPVEIEVEKLLGLDGKEQIEKYGMAPFIEKCKESVWKYKGMWEEFSGKVGFWADMDNPYVTYHNDYIESEWRSHKKIFEKGLLYKGFKIVPYCPRCGTPLSSNEVALGYKDVKERSAVAKFATDEAGVYFLAWTTTPWTLPSNVALCVNPDETYIRATAKVEGQPEGESYILAEKLAPKILGEGYATLETFTGAQLEGRKYLPLFDFCTPYENGYKVVCDDYVTMDDGTGIVHIAPAFGEQDAAVGKKYGLPFVQLVDGKGCMIEPTPWAGMFCKDADKPIIRTLKETGRLWSTPEFEHSYPFCWRCDTPLIYYARESWYIKMTEVRDRLVANNATINWIPESIGKGRFGDWIENVQDWAISRNRYWGTPLPIWICPQGHIHCIGSIAELKSMSDNCPDDIELHRPYIDDVTIKCPECGGEMHRVPEVIDCWYDSGSMPFAQHHYPFENKELFEAQFPADFISEAVDQTRGWFYSLLAISTLIFDKAPYRNVIVLGHVQDEHGQKMSKSKGNAVDPMEALGTFGADAIRWYFYTNSAPWLPNKFHAKAVVEGQRKFMGTLWNTYAFYVLYAEIDKFDPTKNPLVRDDLTVMDRFILSRLTATIRDTDDHLANYRIPEAARVLERFVDELSNWYVRRGRERYWAKELTPDKRAAYTTLWTCLVTVSKLAAPMIPFMAEQIYQNLVRSLDPTAPESVHLCSYPEPDDTLRDEALEDDMEKTLAIVTLARSARNAAAIKNRQPLSAMFVGAKEKITLSDYYRDIIADELNVGRVEFLEDMSELSSYSFKPQLKTVGPKYGKLLGRIKAALDGIDGNAAMRELESTGALTLDLGGESVSLTRDDLLIDVKQKEGYCSVADGGYTVALDTTLTPELIEAGLVRELISKIQTMRKEAGFVVTDRIKVVMSGSDMLYGVARRNFDEISQDTLADSIEAGEGGEYSKEWEIDDEKVAIGVSR